MTILLRTAVLILFICCVFNPALPGLAAEGSRYGQWQTAENQLEKMIKELDQIIAAGIKAKAAHPDFLKDLQNTLDLYRIPKKTVLFSDDFADNDFSSNPVWQIRQGEYIIDRYGSLYSSVAIKKPPPPKEEGTEEDSGGDRGIRVLLGVLNELAKDDMENQAGTETPLDQAVISSNAHIPNSFILEYTFRSTSNWGKTSIGVFQGDELKSGYHLIYQALPGQDRPMQLIRYRYAKPFIVDEVADNSPDLDDGLDHTIRVMRGANGEMVVAVDGKEVLRTSDLSYQGDFSGITISNSGGSYAYDNIEFFIEQ